VHLRDALASRGFTLFTGVPCSFFGGLIASLGEGCYIPAANEGSALAIACGAGLAGKRAVVFAQNSGLGNMVNPLTSLSAVYGLGALLLISHRGDPREAPDEPQHELMGEVTEPLLETMGIPHWRLPGAPEEAAPVLDVALAEVCAGRCGALLVGRGTIAQAVPGAVANSPRPAPEAVFAAIMDLITDELIIATTGYTSRRLFTGHDRPGNFYMQGSMGHAASIGLGVALARPRSRVVVFDGDGACLMHLGALGSVGQFAPGNYLHVVFDNGRYESTGGQPVPAVRYEDAALAAGYRRAARATSLSEAAAQMSRLLAGAGPAMLVIEVGPGGSAPPRATATMSAPEIRSRFSAHSNRNAEGIHL
jgi:phosphonopyruvate decarboxylase